MIRVIKVVAAAAAIAAWFASFSLWMSYDANNPPSPYATLGYVYPLDTHGHIVFITASQKSAISALRTVAIVCFIVVGAAILIERRRRR